MSARIAFGVALGMAWLAAGSFIAAVPRQFPTVTERPHSLSIDGDTRLLVIAPHPDDELLAAGGLIEHVHGAKGTVRVVYLTSGEGYPEGVRVEEGVASPRAIDYRKYGRQREREAKDALKSLGVGPESLEFLGFPNGGLHRLMTRYWSERRVAYRSPFTRLDRPKQSEIVLPGTEFRGEDLTQELATIIGDFRPTLIVVPRKQDQHVDHCAAWFFVADALTDVRRVYPDYRVDLLTYVIHYYSWPFEDDRPEIGPPDGLVSRGSEWQNVVLSDAELKRKRKAIERYGSQMKVMDWFLLGFVRRNEVFERPPVPRVVLPLRRGPCDQFEEERPKP